MRRLRAYTVQPYTKNLLIANVHISDTENWVLSMYTRMFQYGSLGCAAHSKKLYGTSADYAYPERSYVFNDSFIRAAMPGYIVIYQDGNIQHIK